ncbi:MAG TPA: DUF2142 domain-containing protein [Verrucomicrobiae bacterium]|nr:DUF2142 domain-containing protein [Verrucomicrobiae bacterium]
MLAVVHVFVFAAAFPFFNNVDEANHFDLAVKYGNCMPPRQMDVISSEAMGYIAIFGSQEFLWMANSFPDGKYPLPPWTQSPEKMRLYIVANELNRTNIINYEDSQPPVYYAAAGAWWRMGRWLGFNGLSRLYWLRFLNLIIIAAVVWLGWNATRMVFPGNHFIQVGVPMLLAFMPQSAFYAIENDALSPLTFGIAFLCLLKFLPTPTVGRGGAAGLALAATYLTKISNLPLVLAAIAIVVLFAARSGHRFRTEWPAYLSLIFAAALPVLVWSFWSRIAFGDFTGSRAKVEILGWSQKPFSDWFHHPIFTPRGLLTFLAGLTATFWQGEILWHRKPLNFLALNWIYFFITVILAGASATALLRSTNASENRRALYFSFVFLAASVIFLAGLSLIYDFHDCFYPSREYPYFSSGRLMLGALIPSALILVKGFDCLTYRISERWRIALFSGTILLMLISEIVTDWPVFHSQYNWYHM